MEFRILGPLEVLHDGRRVELGGQKSRALLALLLLNANEVVSADRLIDELWPSGPPQNALRAVHVHVSRLRKLLERRENASTRPVIETSGRGYRARVDSDELDMNRFQRLLETGTRALAAGDTQVASDTLREALALWRGPPLADLPLDGDARSRIDALDELRLMAIEERIEADLARGRHAELVSELTLLVREQPLRERLRAQLMLALYRSGRQSDALEVYRQTRRLLVDELGIEPGHELQRLEQAILRQDPALKLPTRAEPSTKEKAPAAPHRRRLRRGVVAVGGLALAIAAGAAAVFAMSDREGASPSGAAARPGIAVASNSLAVIDPQTNRLAASIRVGAGPGPVAIGGGAVWVGNAGDHTVSRIDPRTRNVVATIGLGFEPTGLVASDSAVWVAGGYAGALARIDTADNAVRRQFSIRPRLGPLPRGYERGPSAVALGAGALWLAHGEEVSRIDPETGRVLARVPAGGAWAGTIAFGAGAAWVPENAVKHAPQRRADAADGISRIDPGSNAVAVTLPVFATPFDVAFGEGSVWAVVPSSDTLWQIDPEANRVARAVKAGLEPTRLAVGDGAVWVANDTDRTVTRVDAHSGELTATIDLGRPLEDIAVGERAVWVTAR